VSIVQAEAERGRHGRGLAALGAGLALILRRLRLDPAAPVTLFLLVGATCFLFAAMPRLFDAFSDNGLRAAFSNAPVAARNPRLLEPGRIPAGPAAEPLAGVERHAVRSQHEALPAALDDLVVERAFVVRSPFYVQLVGEGLARYLSLRLPAAGVERQIRVVAGRLPRPADARIRVVNTSIPERARAARVPLLEVALSTTTAHELQVKLGDRLVLQPDREELDVRHFPQFDQRPIAVEVTGTFDVRDPKASFWFGDRTVGTPNVAFTPDLDTKLVHGQALVSPAQYATLLAATAPLRLAYEYRYVLDGDRIDGGRLRGLREAADRIDARYAAAGPNERRVELGLGPVFDRFRSARSQAETLLAVAAIGLLACALANLGLLGVLSYDRRVTETTLSRVRGASQSQTLGGQLAEAALIAVPAGFAGWALAILTIDARGSSLSGWLVAAVVVGTVALLVASIAGVARRPLGSLAPADVVPARPARRRLAVEGLIAVAALLAVFLVRRRGLEGSGSGVSGHLDPYLAAVPVLLGLACGIAVLRLHPYPLQAAARLARRTRGLAIQLGLSRAARQPDTTSLPVLVLVVALAIAAFSATMASTIRAGQEATGQRAIGADVRIDAAEGSSLPKTLVTRLASEGRVARAYVQDAGLSTGTEALLLALDARAYESVVAGTPAAVPLRAALDTPSPIPTLVSTVVSTDWPTGGNFQLPLPNQTVGFLRVGDRRTLPGIPRGTPFAVVSLRALRDAGGEAPVNRLYVGHADRGAVRDAVDELAPGATVTTSAAVARGIREAPLVRGVLRGFDWAVVVASVYAAVALALLVLIAARSRGRDLALVRTMGGSGRDVLALSLVELAPLVVLGLGLGLLLGIALPYLIEPGLDLAFFTGSGSTSIVIPGRTLLGIALGLLVFLAAAALLVGLRTRRANLGRVLRVGER
jgi:putative ABC transport system permease protein